MTAKIDPLRGISEKERAAMARLLSMKPKQQKEADKPDGPQAQAQRRRRQKEREATNAASRDV
jgi:hypothetical protein